MDADTRFILKRIDEVEKRLSRDINALQDFKSKAMGVFAVGVFVVPSVIHYLFKGF